MPKKPDLKRANGLGTITQRRNSFRWQITLGYDGNGKRQTAGGTEKTETLAKKALAQAITDHARGLLAPSDNITVSEYASIWLSRQTTLQDSSRREYAREFGFVTDQIGTKRVKEIRPHHLKNFMVNLSSVKHKPKSVKLTPPETIISPRTQSKVLTRIRALFREAVIDQIIYVNPADGVKRARAPRLDRVGKTLDFPEAARFHALGWALQDAHLMRQWIGLLLCVSLGLRRGEAMGLTWDNVDLPNGTLRIVQALTIQNKKPTISNPKTFDSKREIILPPSLHTALERHRNAQLEERQAARETWTETHAVVSTLTGGFTHPDNLGRALSLLLEWSDLQYASQERMKTVQVAYRQSLIDAISSGIKLPDIRVHDLRHTYATLALRSGVPIEVVSRNLGHAKISTTWDLYRHVLDSERRQYNFDAFQNTPRTILQPAPFN